MVDIMKIDKEINLELEFNLVDVVKINSFRHYKVYSYLCGSLFSIEIPFCKEAESIFTNIKIGTTNEKLHTLKIHTFGKIIKHQKGVIFRVKWFKNGIKEALETIKVSNSNEDIILELNEKCNLTKEKK